MTLELVSGHVRFSWNVGGGTANVEHGLPIEPASSFGDEKDKWYKVYAQRYKYKSTSSFPLCSEAIRWAIVILCNKQQSENYLPVLKILLGNRKTKAATACH